MVRLLDTLLGRTEAALALAVLTAALVFSLASPYFLTPSNAVDLIEAYAVTTILAAGVFVVLVSGGIDISFAATAAATQYVGATLATAYGFGPVAAIGSACLMGALMGAINAVLTHYLAIWSIIVTIATSAIYYALLIQITGGSEIYNLPDWWVDRVVFFRWTFASGEFIRVTLPVVLMLLVVLTTHLIMAHSRMGRQVYALGGNPESASRIGINLLGVRLFAYGWLGALAGLAGFVQAHRVGQAVPTAMAGTELDVLAVAILGGAALTGGVGSMGGVMLGVLLLAMLQNGLNLIGVSPYFFDVVIGLAILLSISLTGYASKRHGRSHQGAFG
jgi:simple sugar transport system permease protein